MTHNEKYEKLKKRTVRARKDLNKLPPLHLTTCNLFSELFDIIEDFAYLYLDSNNERPKSLFEKTMIG